ncbi:MAG: carboxypeptidase regulatory-like domain-containing protein [Clostridia bacterium]|nr:carboxypeptidase regulatory-like domain-containing protein [Clostridia bacterium]
MKKFTLLFLVAAILAFSSFGVAAYAPENDSYTITYNVGAENAGSMYGMVAISGTGDSVSTTNTDDIVYIDQATADAEGNITFTAFAPMGAAPSDAAYVPSTVFIGGPSYSTVQKIGTLDAAAADAFEITGTVKDIESSNRLTNVTVLDAAANEVATTTVDSTGAYKVEAPAGTYSVEFSKDVFSSHTYTNVVVAADMELLEVDMKVHAGDVTGDTWTNLADLSLLLEDYSLPVANAVTKTADVTGDGYINLPDLSALLEAYTLGNTTQDYAALIAQ